MREKEREDGYKDRERGGNGRQRKKGEKEKEEGGSAAHASQPRT